MRTEHRIGAPAISFLLATAVVFLGSSCGQSTSSQTTPTPSVGPSPSAAASAPTGGPVPAQLLGAWFLPTAIVDASVGCVKPLNPKTCNLRLNLLETSYNFQGTHPAGPGDLVVNNNEIDFFNARECKSIGRYTWTLSGGVLHFTALNTDACGRSAYLQDRSFYRSI